MPSAALAHAGLEIRALHPVAHDGDDDVGRCGEPRGGIDEDVEILGEADIAGVHDDERLGQAVGERPRIALRPGDDGRAIRPVVDDRDAAGVGVLAGHEPLPHRLAHRHDAVRARDEPARDAVEQPIDPLAPEVAEEARHLGKHVLAEVDEARAGAAGAARERRGR